MVSALPPSRWQSASDTAIVSWHPAFCHDIQHSVMTCLHPHTRMCLCQTKSISLASEGMTSAICICPKLDQSVSWWGSLLVFDDDDARRGLFVLFGKRLYTRRRQWGQHTKRAGEGCAERGILLSPGSTYLKARCTLGLPGDGGQQISFYFSYVNVFQSHTTTKFWLIESLSSYYSYFCFGCITLGQSE